MKAKEGGGGGLGGGGKNSLLIWVRSFANVPLCPKIPGTLTAARSTAQSLTTAASTAAPANQPNQTITNSIRRHLRKMAHSDQSIPRAIQIQHWQEIDTNQQYLHSIYSIAFFNNLFRVPNISWKLWPKLSSLKIAGNRKTYSILCTFSCTPSMFDTRPFEGFENVSMYYMHFSMAPFNFNARSNS
jgi:hypothetical protein